MNAGSQSGPVPDFLSSSLEQELRSALAEGVRLGELFAERPALAPPWPDLNVLLGWNSAAEETPVREVYDGGLGRMVREM